MKAIDISFIHGRLNRERNGKFQIEIRVYFPHSRQRVYKTTGVWVKHFSEGKVSSREPGHSNLNRQLNSQREEIQNLYDDFVLKKKEFTPEHLRKFFKGEDVRVTFNQFYKETIDKQPIRYSTYIDKEHSLGVLNRFDPIINFATMDYTWVDNFNTFLTKQGFSQNTIFKIHKNIKSIIAVAIKTDMIDKSPYRNYTVKKERKAKYALSKSQIEAIYASEQSEVRDMFLLSCCTGLRYSDVSRLTKDDIKDVDGELYVVLDEMKKVEGRGVTVKASFVFDFGDELLRKYYEGKDHKFFNISNPLANAAIKKMVKTKKPLTFHISRHTFLTHVAAKTGSIFSVMKYGGISNISTAQGYVDMANDLIGF